MQVVGCAGGLQRGSRQTTVGSEVESVDQEISDGAEEEDDGDDSLEVEGEDDSPREELVDVGEDVGDDFVGEGWEGEEGEGEDIREEAEGIRFHLFESE